MTTLYVDTIAFQLMPPFVFDKLIEREKGLHDQVERVSRLSDMLGLTKNPPAGTLLTTVDRRALWAAVAPEVTVAPWNGVPLPSMPLEAAVLIWLGVPADKAREVARRWDNPGRSKWAPLIEQAKDVLEHTSPTTFDPPPAIEIVAGKWSWADDLDDRHGITADMVALDIETTGLSPFEDTLVGVSLANADGAVYIPCPQGQVPPKLRQFLEYDEMAWMGHNAKFDYKFLRAKGIGICPPIHDTQLMAYVLGIEAPRGLKPLAERLLGVSTIHFEDVAQGQSFDRVPIQKAAEYACQDVLLTWALFWEMFLQTERWGKEAEVWDLYQLIELPLIPILAEMELRGAAVDLARVEEMAAQVVVERDMLSETMYTLAGQEFDPQKPEDLRWLLFEKLGLEPIKKTKTGYSVDHETLMRYQDNALVSLILEWRSREKLLGTYLRPLLRDRPTRVHGQFNQMVTDTGRLSSSQPNLQNQGPAVRKVYVAPPGGFLIAADYSQQELRLLAHLSEDPAMLYAFQNGVDIHQQTASLLNIPRKVAKTVNFGIPYGAGPRTIARQAGCSMTEAKQILEQHKQKYPVLWQWLDHAVHVARENGYAETIWGRRRYLPHINGFGELRASAEREAVNMPIQGSAADVTKLAMAKVDEIGLVGLRLILQIHDELVFELDDAEMVEVAEAAIVKAMEDADGGILKVRLTADIHHGTNWSQLK